MDGEQLQALVAEVARLRENAVQQAENMDRQTRINQELQARLIASEGRHTPATTASNIESLEKPRHRLGQLGKFSGKTSEWESWKLGAELKIETDGAAIGNDRDQFNYLYTTFESDAQTRVANWVHAVRAYRPDEVTAHGFFMHSQSVFGDPNAQRNALVKLNSLRQRQNELFSEFLPRFEEILAKANGDIWPDNVKINHLTCSLNDEMSQALVYQTNLSPEYLRFKDNLLTIDAQIQALKARNKVRSGGEGKGTGAPRAKGTGATTTTSGDAMDWEPTVNVAKWVSQDEIKRRKENNLCLRCGKDGHMIAACRMKPAKRPLQVAEANVDSKNSAESGKE